MPPSALKLSSLKRETQQQMMQQQMHTTPRNPQPLTPKPCTLSRMPSTLNANPGQETRQQTRTAQQWSCARI